MKQRMSPTSPQSLKAQVRKAALRAYADLLIDDPSDITDQHFKILLKDMSPGEIIYATSRILGKESDMVNMVIGRFNNYMEKAGSAIVNI
ncbi:MAG TPA: hypothetical protein VGA21_02555 [Cyclobacteriaceae bacterium]